MLTRRWRNRAARTRRRGALFVLAVLLAQASGIAAAVEMTSLYTAEVPLDPALEDPRAVAYSQALYEVLLRVSGSGLADDAGLVDALFPNPALYVVQFRPGREQTLWVSFDGGAIERTLRQAGQPVWGAERPLTLVWLAVDWGQGEREIVAAADAEARADESRSIDRNRLLRQRILDIARRRGLPVVLPLLDTEDLARVAFADIWGGFDEQVLAASERYQADSVLIGRISPASARQNRWTYYFGGDQRSYVGEPETVLGQVADLLAAEFAVGSAPLSTVELSVSGIDSVEAYGAVQRLLSGVSIIERMTMHSVEGDRIRYRVEAYGGADRLSRALVLAGLIEQQPSLVPSYPAQANGLPPGGGDRPPGAGRDAPSLEFFFEQQ